MNVKCIYFIILAFFLTHQCAAQELYGTINGETKYGVNRISLFSCAESQIIDSLYYNNSENIFGIWDIAISKNGELFLSSSSIDTITFNYVSYITLTNLNGLNTIIYEDSVYQFPGLVADSNNILYSTCVNVWDSSDNVLLRYNINTNQYAKDTLPAGLRTAGDLTFYNDNLYACCLNGEIWHVDLQTPIQSNLVSIAHTLNGEIIDIIGIIATKITCDSTLVIGNTVSFAENGELQTDFYQINLFTGLCTYICSAENAYGGIASPQEFAPPPEATTQYDSLSVCMGAEVMYANTPHIITHDTTLCTTYTSVLGCDSTRCLRLMVSPSVTLNQDITHCKGDVYNFENISLTRDTNICRSYITATGCDSTYCLHLTFRDTSSVQLTQQICEGDSYTFEGQSYSSDTLVCRTYQNALGCDSTRCLRLSLMPISTFNQNEIHCKGDVYNFENLSLTRDTSICRTYTSATGCDSTYCLNLSFQDTASQLVIQQICDGDSYTFEGQAIHLIRLCVALIKMRWAVTLRDASDLQFIMM